MMNTDVKSSISGSIVLIVDDSPDTLGMLNDALEHEDLTTLVALEGKQAISISQKMHPDVILLDAIMPHMDGFETCRRLKQNPALKNTPIIFMTGLSDSDSIVRGFDAGGIDYLTKPINPQELIARLKSHLANARTTADAQQALDKVGQKLFSVNSLGQKCWSTPAVDHIFASLSDSETTQLATDIAHWLGHSPVKGSKLYFTTQNIQLSLIYFGESNGGELLLRLIDTNAANESRLLQQNFGVTPRESEVFLWLAKGKTNREIAQILEMSPRTVNKHLEQIFKKLEVDNRTLAASRAIACLQAQNPA